MVSYRFRGGVGLYLSTLAQQFIRCICLNNKPFLAILSFSFTSFVNITGTVTKQKININHSVTNNYKVRCSMNYRLYEVFAQLSWGRRFKLRRCLKNTCVLGINT